MQALTDFVKNLKLWSTKFYLLYCPFSFFLPFALKNKEQYLCCTEGYTLSFIIKYVNKKRLKSITNKKQQYLTYPDKFWPELKEESCVDKSSEDEENFCFWSQITGPTIHQNNTRQIFKIYVYSILMRFNRYIWLRSIIVYQKYLKRTFITSFWVQNYILNLCIRVVNSQRLFCFWNTMKSSY